jgi:hypothetical protein
MIFKPGDIVVCIRPKKGDDIEPKLGHEYIVKRVTLNLFVELKGIRRTYLSNRFIDKATYEFNKTLDEVLK